MSNGETPGQVVTIPVELLADLIDVASWHQGVCNSMRAGETYDNQPDKNAFDYLQSEVISIGQPSPEPEVLLELANEPEGKE